MAGTTRYLRYILFAFVVGIILVSLTGIDQSTDAYTSRHS